MWFKQTLLLLIAATAFAQSDPEVRPFQFGLFYPFSSNGREATRVANRVSLNAVWGVSAGVRAFEFSGLGNTTHGSVEGAQLAGFMNIVEGPLTGAQAAGFMNICGASAHGVQAAGFMNILGGDLKGAQAAGFMNIAQNVEMLQAAGFMNIAGGDVTGLQGAGFMNIAEAVRGVQYAGFANINTGINGVQAAGFMNVAGGTVRGVQGAGFLNIASAVEGLQVSGFMNLADRVEGVMIAGFLNIAESCDYPVGIINLIGDGRRTLYLSGDEWGTFGLTFKSGSKTYGLIGADWNPEQEPLEQGWHVGLGLGFPLKERVNLALEAVSTVHMPKWTVESWKEEVSQVQSLRLVLEYSRHRFGLFGGPTLNLLLTNRSDVADLVASPLWERSCSCEFGKFQKLYAGVNLGVFYRLPN